MTVRSFAAAAALVASALTVTPAQAAPGETWRVGGADRYATALAVSRDGWLTGQATPIGAPVVVASGTGFADGLAAASGSAAGRFGSPLLLVPPSGPLPPGLATEVRRLGGSGVVVAGGAGAVSTGVEAQLARIVGARNVTRVAGVDRYATAARLAEGLSTGDTVYLASGEDYADALAVGAVANARQRALLLTRRTTLPAQTSAALAALRPMRVVVVGGVGVVSDAVVAAVHGVRPGAVVVRVGGVDRYATAAAISRSSHPTASTVLVASGEGFADAMAGGAKAGFHDEPLLLARRGCLPRATLDEVARLGATTVVVLGGVGALSDAVARRQACS